MPRQPAAIDRDKLRAAVRKLGHEYVFYMLDDAIDILPPAKLHQIAKKYLDLKSLRPDSEIKTKANLLAAVKAFDKLSRAGEYYESFMVNSKNYTAQSTGTTAWIAEWRRLIDRCVAEEKKGSPTDVREAFDILFGLLDYIDVCNDDVIFFADDGGSWQVGADWDKVLPPWFKVLSATASPEEYAVRITALLKHHYNYGRDKMLVAARKIATPEQRKALADSADQQASRRRGGTKP
ncbi:MAG: hypothetical protein MUC50_05230 [Myxococcota bacterium]|jgi:hypothetical protein|nr:hypothetical protein [Myxococcota bacterium]